MARKHHIWTRRTIIEKEDHVWRKVFIDAYANISIQVPMCAQIIGQ